MKLNWKIIIGGGILMYIVQFIGGMITGMLIHEGVLEPIYDATAQFWRPELIQDPPDMAALMPRWIGVGILTAFIHAAIYDNIRSAFDGSGLMRGLKFGLMMAVIFAMFGAAFSGVFNLPGAIWGWWALEGFLIYPLGGLALGWFVAKYASD